MRKLNVTQRVFLAILAANAIVVLCMFLIMQWSMDRGFLRYANQLEQDRTDRLAAKLGKAYGVSGSWEFVIKSPESVSRLIVDTVTEITPQLHPPPVASESMGPPNQQEGNPNRRSYRFEKRIVVIDANKNRVFGSSNPSDIKLFKPISDKGKVVGFLGLLPNKFLSDRHQLKFVKDQKYLFALIAMLMLLVAAAISLPLA
ncbi:MAG TPA: two-component sensor histidine kinase, partial [Desulfuromonadales bacterium]|nr:two-component sensor histidine kinase [Desulfuromonadales bacterium]